MTPIEIIKGHKSAVVSFWNGLYVVKGRNGGATKSFKTLRGATAAANQYVGK